MRTRTIIAILLAFMLTVGLSAIWSAEGDEQEGDTATNIVASAESPAGASDAPKPKKKGNRFFRAFKAPFKAVGKIFGGGDDAKVARMTEKDGAKFESYAVERVEDRDNKRPQVTGSEGSALEHLDRGRALLDSGHLSEAITELSRAASLDPRLGRAHSLLAVAYERKGMNDRASDAHKRAVEADERDAQAMNNLGYSLYLNGHYRTAVDRLKRAAKLAPHDARIWNNLALAQCRLGKYDDAFKSFARAGDEFQARMNVAALLERAGRDEKAIDHYEHARRLQPAATAPLRRLVELYERTGRRDDAQTARQNLDTVERHETALAGGGGE
ncbi:MAG TPA: tetratricopeptide repeat protein [Pyrinomonadaceae bacterium]|nr:tetratricopeptide repeat protein [Pyrinomonadaceae bacterium]